ncbi:FeoC-like transcriptional regulator [Vibrio hippocampi]|uniref:Transcriptional regulator HTH-type FeoC domain-containing protein n=1 Tax=Vibrio hippocampi TaxID=654686 RepID=A0ABM8ZFB5_9VIBR|nr:FeoC-like transcriptional regulator [Vibrio hippocampi]CAH0525125.1 hypothetical protein VHP8226_00791 [Vibrio hippocampi]
MILSELKSHIESHPGVTRGALAKHFALSEDGVDAMLQVWLNKGQVSRTEDCDKQGNILGIRYHLNQAGAFSLQVKM